MDITNPSAGISRRRLIQGAGAGAAALALAGCDNSLGSNGGPRIDQRVESTRSYLLSSYPGTQDLESKASGALWMPLITKAGFGVGGSYGTGALRINSATVDYYAAVSANFGFQAGAQQYSHVLFFMTPDALREFRTSPGWSVGGDAEYALIDQGGNVSAETLTALSPVIAFVYGQTGLILGATLEGSKYQRIIP